MKSNVHVNLLFKAVRQIEQDHILLPKIVYAIRKELKKFGYIVNKHYDKSNGYYWTETKKEKS